MLGFPIEIINKAALAERLIGKFDGIKPVLPVADFFLIMYIIKDATCSAQIEGTRATMIDSLEMRAGLNDSRGPKKTCF